MQFQMAITNYDFKSFSQRQFILQFEDIISQVD